MKKILMIVLVMFLLGSATFASSIRATAQPQADAIAIGQNVEIPVMVDLSNLPEALGSYTAILTWNPKALKYISASAGKTTGFSSPVVNDQKAEQGELLFASANPKGATGKVNILNVVFQVNPSAIEGADLDLQFTAMAAAYTFYDLLPYLAVATNIDEKIRVTELPTAFVLQQNYPNPFNPQTRIQYQLPKQSHVKLAVYNSVGQQVATLVDEIKSAGHHAIVWSAKDDQGQALPAGIYVYRIKAGDFTSVRKMLLVK